jgi:hypothetical protein
MKVLKETCSFLKRKKVGQHIGKWGSILLYVIKGQVMQQKG